MMYAAFRDHDNGGRANRTTFVHWKTAKGTNPEDTQTIRVVCVDHGLTVCAVKSQAGVSVKRCRDR